MNMPIPTESTNGGDITADQDPSEELRLLRDRIAEFERQQSINSPKEEEKKGTNDESIGKKLEQSKKTILTLGGQWRRCGDPYRIAGAIVLFIFLVYIIREFNEQKEYRLKMNGQNDKIESNNDKESTADQQEEEQKKSDELKHLREKIKQFELELKQTKGIVPNRWDSAACHPSLVLSELGRLIVQYNGKENGWSSVMGEKPMSKHPYFEVKIVEKTSNIFIGLATKRMPLDKPVGTHKGTYGYDGLGRFWGLLEVDGCRHRLLSGRPWIGGKPEFGVGDVIGCGVNLATRQIIYTKNGERLDTANLFVTFAAELFPCVTLYCPGAKIEANFGLNFEYKF